MNREIAFRKPNPKDGIRVWELVKAAGSLDVNSAYCYMMICDYFRDTSAVAESDGEIVGFVSAFSHPGKSGTLFVWQIAVSASVRGMGIGSRLLDTLMDRKASEQVRHIETTISPSNMPSRSLFAGLAKRYQADIRMSQGYPKEWFPASEDHEEELLFQIGPIRSTNPEGG